MRSISAESVLRITPLLGLAFSICLAVWGIYSGVFTSARTLQDAMISFGALAPLLFVLVQAVQVVIPILPGGISCLAGVVLFGAAAGFIYNYIGICIGSILAFALARSSGRPLLVKMFGQKKLEKYDQWTKKKNRFDRLFAAAIFLPVAPDDFLCYLAGTTTMPWKKFILIILLGKPFAILMYSFLLNTAWEQILLFLK